MRVCARIHELEEVRRIDRRTAITVEACLWLYLYRYVRMYAFTHVCAEICGYMLYQHQYCLVLWCMPMASVHAAVQTSAHAYAHGAIHLHMHKHIFA